MKKYDRKPIIMEYLAELVKASFENRVPADIPREIEFETLKNIALESQMVYLILGSLVKLPLEKSIIEEIKPYLYSSTIKTLQQVCDAKKIQKELEEAGVRNQVLKGTVMKHLYPRPEMREMSDVDFMIYEDNFDKAQEIMVKNGYRLTSAEKHHYVYFKAPFMYMEMHWDLYEKTVDKEQYMYYKNNMRAYLNPNSSYIYNFSNEDFYVYMISHMAKHFYENGCGIRNIIDVYVYREKMKDQVDWKIVDEELKKCGLCDFEKHIVELAYIWLGDNKSTVFYNRLFMYMLDCGIYGKSENGVWAQIVKLKSEKDIQNGNISFIRYCLPPMKYMKEYYPWLKKVEFLLPIAWLMRGIHGISSKSAKERAKTLIHGSENELNIKELYEKLNLKFVK